MIRLYVLVEGQTEEHFVKRLLEPHLREHGISTTPIIVETSRDRAGRKRRGGGDWTKWRKDLQRLRSEHQGFDARFTTLFDLYGLPRNFPGLDEHGAVPDTGERARRLQDAMSAEIGDRRLIPYLQRHEFEALVLVGLPAIASLLDNEDRAALAPLQSLLATLGPEDVDDGEESAPSKRLEACIPGYQKTIHGPLAIEAAGLEALRNACPRFESWLATLEGLAEGVAP